MSGHLMVTVRLETGYPADDPGPTPENTIYCVVVNVGGHKDKVIGPYKSEAEAKKVYDDVLKLLRITENETGNKVVSDRSDQPVLH